MISHIKNFIAATLLTACLFNVSQGQELIVDSLMSRITNPSYQSIDSTQKLIEQLHNLNAGRKNTLLESKIKLLQARILLAQNNPDSARVLLHESEAFFNDNARYEYGRDHGIVLLLQSRASMAKVEYLLARKAAMDARTIFQRAGENYLESLAVTFLGNLDIVMENPDEAIKHYLEAQKIPLKENEKLDASIPINLALAYNQIGQYQAALPLIRNSLKDKSIANGPPRGFINLYSILGSIHMNLKHYDSALLYLEKSRSYAIQINSPSEVALSEYRLAEYFSTLGNINKSNAILKRILARSRESVSNTQIDVQLLLAKNYYSLKRMDSCILVSNHAFQNFGKQERGPYSIRFAMLLGNAYEKLNRDSAIHYLQLSSVLKDSVYGPDKQKVMSSLFAEMETLTKQNEIKVLKKQSDLNRAENQILLVSIIFGSAVALLIVTLLVLNYKNRKRKHELITYELQHQLELRKTELDQQMARIMYINDGITKIEETLKKLKIAQPDHAQAIQQALNAMHMNRSLEKEWNHFDNYFGNVHVGFFENFTAQFPTLSIMERRLASLVRMNLTNPQIAGILNIEGKSVKVAKHRLKKKLGLNEEDDLSIFLHSIDGVSPGSLLDEGADRVINA